MEEEFKPRARDTHQEEKEERVKINSTDFNFIKESFPGGDDVFVGNRNFVYNTECLFVEFHDIIAMPWYAYICMEKESTLLHDYFLTDNIIDFNPKAMYEWYVMRPYQNVLKSIGINPGFAVTDEELDIILAKLASDHDDYYKYNTNLAFYAVLLEIVKLQTLVKRIIIYTPWNEKWVDEYISNTFNSSGTNKIDYKYGDIRKILQTIPNDSTYVFSDITHINDLIALNKINYSSIIIGDGYRYNRKKDNINEYKVDINQLQKDYICKVSLFDALSAADMYTDNGTPIPVPLYTMMVLDELAKENPEEDGIN